MISSLFCAFYQGSHIHVCCIFQPYVWVFTAVASRWYKFLYKDYGLLIYDAVFVGNLLPDFRRSFLPTSSVQSRIFIHELHSLLIYDIVFIGNLLPNFRSSLLPTSSVQSRIFLHEVHGLLIYDIVFIGNLLLDFRRSFLPTSSV